jgi:hypothetical protein
MKCRLHTSYIRAGLHRAVLQPTFRTRTGAASSSGSPLHREGETTSPTSSPCDHTRPQPALCCRKSFFTRSQSLLPRRCPYLPLRLRNRGGVQQCGSGPLAGYSSVSAGHIALVAPILTCISPLEFWITREPGTTEKCQDQDHLECGPPPFRTTDQLTEREHGWRRGLAHMIRSILSAVSRAGKSGCIGRGIERILGTFG